MKFLASFLILPRDEDSGARHMRVNVDSIKGGTMEMKIARIALAHEATRLTRNVIDFIHVPGLRIENWLD